MNAPAQKQQQPDVRMLESTYFWHLEEDGEAELARLYVATKYPNTEALVVSELLIPRLTERNHVVILARDGRRHPLEKVWRDPTTGQRLTDRVPLDTLVSSVRESPIIAIAPYIEGGSKHQIGKFRSNAFFDECGKHITGTMRVQAEEQTVRYLSC